MTRVALLGSTGSIGTQTIDVVDSLGDDYQIVALAAGRNTDLLAEQIEAHKPRVVAVADEAARSALLERLRHRREVLVGDQGLVAVATCAEADIVVTAVTGALGLKPILAALEAGKRVAPANKEPLVVAGELIMALARRNGQPLVPIDSEHSAIYQCLHGEDPTTVERLLLTASGGPFRQHTTEQLQHVTVDEALNHPTWNMGPKITVDSASLMNKGLEVIEARWLFDLPPERIDVVVHPQSIIHSMVEFCDGSVLAQMDYPDMRTPIQFALTYPTRQPSPRRRLDPTQLSGLTFEAPRLDDFPCLRLAYEAAAAGGTVPCVMNAANEVAVQRFLDGELSFPGIAALVESVMARHASAAAVDLDSLLDADAWARAMAGEVVV